MHNFKSLSDKEVQSSHGKDPVMIAESEILNLQPDVNERA